MAKGNIDPAFQAAPYLGDSSHDPIEFTRRQTAMRYQRNKQRQAEIEKNTAKGLEKLLIDLDGWNDQEGFKEVMKRQQKVKDIYMDLASKGANLVNPTTEGEVMAYKAITDYHAKTKEIADLRNAQKIKIDVINKLRMEEQKKDPEAQVVDWDATDKNLLKAFNDNTIAGRDEILNNALVTKPQIGDSYKYVEDHKNALPKLDQVQVAFIDPETGLQNTRLEVQWTPEKVRETEKKLRELYRAAPEKIKNSVKIYRDQNTELKLASDEDAFVAQHMPEYQEKIINKVSGGGGGFNVGFSFLGASGKIKPGEHHDNDVQYGKENFNNRYDFSFPTAKTLFIPPLGGEYSTEDEWKPVTGAGGPLEGNLQFYDIDRDMLVFKLSQDARYPWIKNNTTIRVPRKNLAEADDLPVKLPNGKLGKLKDILPKEDTKTVGRNTVLRNSGLTWK